MNTDFFVLYTNFWFKSVFIRQIRVQFKNCTVSGLSFALYTVQASRIQHNRTDDRIPCGLLPYAKSSFPPMDFRSMAIAPTPPVTGRIARHLSEIPHQADQRHAECGLDPVEGG
jgi:hypothetical protein